MFLKSSDDTDPKKEAKGINAIKTPPRIPGLRDANKKQCKIVGNNQILYYLNKGISAGSQLQC